jgi:hypothetical protein
VHCCCAAETLVHLEYFHDHVRIEHLLFSDGVPEPRGGVLPVDRTRPGLGLTLDADAVERHRT